MRVNHKLFTYKEFVVGIYSILITLIENVKTDAEKCKYYA